jgi:hypothetical protein
MCIFHLIRKIEEENGKEKRKFSSWFGWGLSGK